MKFVNCAVEENKSIPGVLDMGADMNIISYKYISELGITYNSENNSIEAPDVSYSTLGKINLHISFDDGEKHKRTPIEFIVLGPEWPDYYPVLVLGMPWFRENGATLDICNSKLLLDDNFAISLKEVPMQYPE
jgi:hypothetical protein